MKDELDGKIMKEFVKLIAKSYSYLMDEGSEFCILNLYIKFCILK